MIGASGADAAGNTKGNAGESYLIFGSANPPATIDLASLGSDGVTIYGADASDDSGFSVSAAGDVNGDGFNDMLIGAYGAGAASNIKSNAGESYLIFGGASLPATIDLASLGSAGVILYGAEASDRSGKSVSAAGDVNGDGFDDLLIGAYTADVSLTRSAAGKSYLIYGNSSLPTTIDLASLGSAGVIIDGDDQTDHSGRSVSAAGDVNGDGFDDLLIGAWRADAASDAKNDAGETYLIYGGPSLPSTIDLASLGSAGVIIFGVDTSDYSGISVSGAGDINGDGFDDLLIGTTAADAAGNGKFNAGESYLIFGGPSLPVTIDLASLGSAGATIYGADAGDRSGGSVSGAGDVNGDGFDDLLVGASLARAAGNAKAFAGESYLIFGDASLPTTIELASLGGSEVIIYGAGVSDRSGGSVSSAGDVNGDGFDDLLIGASGADSVGNARSEAGESYVIFGGDLSTGVVTHQGTAVGETLSGDTTANVMVGGGGDDELIGGGGADSLRGGEGDDTLAISDLSFLRAVGGNGTDTLRLDASGVTLDLTSLADNRLLGIEQIDISGSGANTLVLDASEVLNISDESNTLVVYRDNDDPVELGNGWTQRADEMIGPDTFNVFSQGQAMVKVQADGPLTAGFRIDLAALSAAQGSVLYGVDADDESGNWVSNAGDVNGDGFDDLLVGALAADAAGNAKNDAGESYLIFGSADPLSTIDFTALGGAGVIIEGADTGDESGISVSGAGDVNGDGFDDLLIGAWAADAASNAKPYAGETYLIYGGASLPTTIDLASLGSAGVIIFGVDTGDRSGISVSSAGDINGDGFDDLLIGAHGGDAQGNAKSGAGESYVVFGGASLPTTIDLASLGSSGVIINGRDSGDLSGFRVSGSGDVNGDGFDDLLIGAFRAWGVNNDARWTGESYVIFGGASLPSTIDLSSLDVAGVTIFGLDQEDYFGRSISTAGDVNGDGFDDLLIGAWRGDATSNAKTTAGESYLVFGGVSLPTTIDLANLGSAGILIDGADQGDGSGWSVSAAGDVNGDGFDEIIIGARGADAEGNLTPAAGASYLVFGGPSLPPTIDLANPVAGVMVIDGADAGDLSGSVSSAGDVNGDGFDDLLIGAYRADAAGNTKSNAGESYMIYGGDLLTGVVTHQGTAAGETLTGDTNANVIIGGGGDDELIGGGGADSLRGGEGEDTLAISDLSFLRAVGGSGTDTLRLDTSGVTLDLTTLPDNRLLGIEQVDIGGNGANSLTLDLQEVLNISDESNTLTVHRDADDTVNIGLGWTEDAVTTIGPDVFQTYVQGNATLLVEIFEFDFGDAPAPYPTTLAEDGARHEDAGPRLGDDRDTESDGIHSALADADGSDEDGVMFGSIGTNAIFAAVNIDLQNAASAKVDAWIDFDGNGIWESSERILASADAVGGLQTLNFTVPATAVAGNTFARVRVSTAGGLQPTGLATDGEVEDYQVTIHPAVPQVESVTIGDGIDPTRSKVTSVTVQFDSEVDHTALDTAFSVTNTTNSIAVGTVNVSASNSGGKTTAVLTFTGASTIAPVNGTLGTTLADGNYRLDIAAGQVRLATNNVATMPVDYAFGGQTAGEANNDDFFRWYGDSNGDGNTDFIDFAGGFLPAFGIGVGSAGYDESLDFDGDGNVDFLDFSNGFLPNFGTGRP